VPENSKYAKIGAHFATKKLSSSYSTALQFKKSFGGFIYAMIFSCARVFKFFSALPDGATIEYEISNRGLSDFLRAYYCNFLNNVYR